MRAGIGAGGIDLGGVDNASVAVVSAVDGAGAGCTDAEAEAGGDERV